MYGKYPCVPRRGPPGGEPSGGTSGAEGSKRGGHGEGDRSTRGAKWEHVRAPCREEGEANG
jgi:hypothetical protein